MNSADKPQKFLFAGFISRLIAFVVDVFLILATAIILGLTMRVLLNFFTNIVPFLRVSDANRISDLTSFISLGALQIIYFVFFWTVFGQTPGMTLMGLQVVRRDGKKPRILRSILRYFGYLLSFVCLGLGFLWILVDRQRRGWHDKLAGTYVMYSEAARLYHQQIEAAKPHAPTTAQQTLSESAR